MARIESKPSSKELTPKQLHFARCVAAGMSQSDAYREAYNVGQNTKASSVHEKASRLMAESKIRARVDAMVAAKERAVVASALSDRQKVLERLRYLLDHATPQDSGKLRAAELLGKSVGLFRDVVEQTGPRSTDEILAEIEERLAMVAADDESVIGPIH